MTTLPEFPKADYYDCGETEVLTHKTPEEAVEYEVDCWGEPGCDASTIIRERGSLTVTCYQRMVVPDNFPARIAASMVEGAVESWGEEFGNPYDAGDEFPEAAVAAARAKLEAAIRELYAAGTVWGCEVISDVVLDAEQIEAMMREHRPDWWKP